MNLRHPLRFALLLLSLAVLVPARAAGAESPLPTAKPDATLHGVERAFVSLERFTLKNGMRVVLAPSHTTSTVGISVTCDVGSSAEPAGRSGFAHLFEHLMFEGSKHAPKGQHFTMIAARGGILNGTTDADRTNFYEELPSGELALGLWLESDRLRYLNVTQTNFENQRAVVGEEFRLSVQNRAYAPAQIRLGELVFANYPAYAHSTIGSLAELDAANLTWVRQFHERYYTPENAVLCLAGDFEPQQARSLVGNYFDTPTARAPRVPNAFPGLPGAVHASREVLVDANAATPALLFGFMVPPTRTPDHYALELLADILAGTESSRLNWFLVHEQAAALETSAGCDGHRGADQFSVQVVLTDTGKLDAVEAAVTAELTRLREEPPTLEELVRAQQRQRTQFLQSLQTNLDRCIRLGEFETEYGNARLLADELEHYLAVTPQDLRAAAQRYLTPERMAVIEVHPRGKSEAP